MDKPATEVQPNADNSVHKAEGEEQDTLEAGAAADQVNLFLQYMIHILHFYSRLSWRLQRRCPVRPSLHLGTTGVGGLHSR